MIPTPGVSTEFDLIPVIFIVLILAGGLVGFVFNKAEKVVFAIGIWVVTLGLIAAGTLYSAVKMGWITL